MTETTFIEVQSSTGPTRLRVSDTGGEGLPVVLVHPWPQRLDIWQPQVDALVAEGYRVVSYDRPGFGESAPAAAYDYDTLTDYLEDLIRTLGLTDVTLVGWSMGGGEVARYVGRFGTDRLRGVAFLAAVPPYLRHTEDNPEGPVTDEVREGQAAAFRADPDGFLSEIARMFVSVDGTVLTDAETAARMRGWALAADHAAVLGCHEAFSKTDFRHDVAGIDVPVAIIHGDADDMVPLRYSGARMHALLPEAAYTVIPGAPHGLGVTHPAEVNEALLSFLGGSAGR